MMILFRRLVLTVSFAIAGLLAVAVAAVAAGGGLAPGDYSFASTSAFAAFGGKGGPPDQPSFAVFVNRGLNSFQPENSDGSETVTHNTLVQFSLFTPTISGGGCFIVPDSDFVVAKNVQSASLHTTLTTANMCPTPGKPVTGKSDVAPVPPGKGGGLPLPLKLDVTWIGLGATSTTHDRSTFRCLDFSTRSALDLRSAGANSTAGVSALTGTFNSASAGVSVSDQHLEISGTIQPNCLGA